MVFVLCNFLVNLCNQCQKNKFVAVTIDTSTSDRNNTKSSCTLYTRLVSVEPTAQLLQNQFKIPATGI